MAEVSEAEIHTAFENNLTSTDQIQTRDTSTLDEAYRRELLSLFRELRSHALAIVEYYKDNDNRRGVDLSRHRMHNAASRLHEHLDRGIQPGIEYLLSLAYIYDLDESTRANGYRSFVLVVERCCQRLLTLMRYIACHRDSLLFRLDHNSRELDAYVTALGQLRACLYYLHKFVAFCGQGGSQPGRLFPEEQDGLSDEDKLVAEQIMREVEMLCQQSFYGRCLGFQFCESMIRPLTTINLVLASFSQGYQHGSALWQIASSVFSGGKYMMDPDCRGEQVVNATRNGDIAFCKAFWSLSENLLMHKVPTLICPSLRVNHVFTLVPVAFEMPRTDGSDTVTITVPCANTGPGPVSLRLLSRDFHQGQDELINTQPKNMSLPSTGLIIHCHGGGFVALSSASHEVYLRHWACKCNVPILCVDYSLAPEQKYPRQLEEVFFAYCWALKNCRILGTTAQRVCIVGDSAGATLAVATALRAISVGVRIPDGVLSIYGCLLVKYAPSPSRLLSLMDPLLPLGVLPKCLAAYTGICADESEKSYFPFMPPCNKASPDNAKALEADKMTSPCICVNDSPQILSDSSNKDELPVASASSNLYTSDDSGFVECPLTPATAAESSPVMDIVDSPSSSNDVLVSGSDTGVAPQKKTLRERLRLNLGGVGLRRKPEPSSSSSVLSPVKRTSSTPVFLTPVESPSKILADEADEVLTSPCSADGAFNTPTYAKIRHFAQSPIQQPFSRTAVVVARNPYMSPMLAGDDLLSEMCPVYLVTCHLDPMLDDSISFGQRLRQIGRTVHCDVLDGLPHGFLNFVLVSPEAKAGSELCIRRLREILLVVPNVTAEESTD